MGHHDDHRHHHHRGPRLGLELTVPLRGGRRPPPAQTTTTTVVYNQPQVPPQTVVINNTPPSYGAPAQVYSSEVQYTGVQPAQVYNPGQPMYVQPQSTIIVPGSSTQTVVVTSSPTPPRRPRVGVNLNFRI